MRFFVLIHTAYSFFPPFLMVFLMSQLRVEEILIRGLKWSKLLDPDNKGQWWLSGGMAAKTDNVQEVANTIDKDVLEAQKMLQLASSQRMNTDARKAIFCIIMSGEDYIDAFEKLLRLDLVGKQVGISLLPHQNALLFLSSLVSFI
jgi:hypothetical protein